MVLIVQCDAKVPAGTYGQHLARHHLALHQSRLYAGEKLPGVEQTSAIVVLGGYMGTTDTDAYPYLLGLKDYMSKAVEHGVPLLGICLGGQLLAEVLGAKVNRNRRGEKGLQDIALTAEGLEDPLFAGLPPVFQSFEWHNDSFEIPPGAVHLAATELCAGQAFRFGKAYGLQFHPEVDRAIVLAWTRKHPDHPAYLAAFRAEEKPFRIQSLRLLDNFLKTIQR